jgi:hypothetical protein
MKKKKSNIKSTCCKATIRFSDFTPDFVGEDPKTMKIGTCQCICTKCNEPCTIYVTVRKIWRRNPKTQIIPNKKIKKSTKLTAKELKEIHKNEDF